jgi:hypothetical protein
MRSDQVLSMRQQQVMTLLAQGTSVAEAAAAARVRRNTVSNWRRAGSPAVREAWRNTRYDAISALRRTLENPAISSQTTGGQSGHLWAHGRCTNLHNPAQQPLLQPKLVRRKSLHNPAQVKTSRKPIPIYLSAALDGFVPRIALSPIQWIARVTTPGPLSPWTG